MGESAEIAVAAGSGAVKTAFADRSLTFSHDEEVSSPHYYKTIISSEDTPSITAELSATSRVGHMRFTFDSEVVPHIVVQATREKISGEITIDPVRREIVGWNPERQDSNLGPFTATDFKGYFVARFDTDFTAYGVANNSTLTENSVSGVGEALSAYVQFPMGLATPVINVRVGISYISIDQARQNLDAEIPDGTSLEETAASTETLWAQKLDLVELTGASEDDLVIFYTSMYHALQYPNEMMEFNASGGFYYSGFDNAVHAGDAAYTGYSIWDTYRAEWSFINLFAPERVDGMIQSMLQTFQEGGRLPIWQNIVETNIMIGTHSSSLIAESMAKGFTGFDYALAWKALLKDATVPPDDDLTTMYYDRQPNTACEARAGLTRAKSLGYVPAILTSEAGSRTLEYAYDDYTVAVAARITGHPTEEKFFMERSRSYRNIFNNDTMFMQARFEDGSWCDNKNTWTEADAWVYTFNVQHDFPGLRDLFLGAEAFGQKLDEYYEGGHNNQANEPSHATVYAYMYANEPAKMQSTIRGLLNDNYFNTPIGLSGNDDCGQMSAWYVFNTMGFYPVNPASAEYMVGTPLFDKITVKFPQAENTLVISSTGARNKPYVQSFSVDGAEIQTPILKHTDLLGAQSIEFTMSDKPQTWGAGVL